MRYLKDEEEKETKKYFKEASQVAGMATCLRSKCGSIIVKNGEVIGSGYNSPPINFESQRRCKNNKSAYDQKVTDKTCCVHAEQRAIIDALKKYPNKLLEARLYFIRLDDNRDVVCSGEPYCTICSKMALDVGIAEFVLWHDDGICVYDTQEYNDLSYTFTQ